MTFHIDKDFKDAILKTSEYFKICEVIIEKDYWATHVLKTLTLFIKHHPARFNVMQAADDLDLAGLLHLV